MMLHGYCVTENPWLISAVSTYCHSRQYMPVLDPTVPDLTLFKQSNFTNAAYFLDVNGNIPNDKFAQLIDQFAKKNNMDR